MNALYSDHPSVGKIRIVWDFIPHSNQTMVRVEEVMSQDRRVVWYFPNNDYTPFEDDVITNSQFYKAAQDVEMD